MEPAGLPLNPYSRSWGHDRGASIARYWIEKFLLMNNHLIRGAVLEMADSAYTRRFGEDRVTQPLVFDLDSPTADFIGDLSQTANISEGRVDCFILTQTFNVIFDVKAAVRSAVKILKPGGHLLITVPGISHVTRQDMARWGMYWTFTDLCLRKLLAEIVPEENITVQAFGNVKLAACFLYGLSQQDLNPTDFEYNDPDYQLIVTAVVKKPD